MRKRNNRSILGVIVHIVNNSVDKGLRTLGILLILIILQPSARAATPYFGDFAQFGTRDNAEAFARDIGALLGSGSYHTGRILGFAGFSAGFHYAYQFKPDPADKVMTQTGVGGFGFPWFQAEIGLPLKFDGFIRGFTYEGLTMAGGGLRYSLFTVTDMKGAPQGLLTFTGASFVHDAFSGSDFGGHLVFSATYPYFKPYIGGGVDRTRLVVKQSNGDPTLLDSVFVTYAATFSAGVTVSPLPFSFLNVAFVERNGNPGFEAGAGARF